VTDDKPGLAKPAHLATSNRAWVKEHVAATVALALGILSFAVVAIAQHSIWDTPDWRISVPGFVATLVAAVASFARREKAWLVCLAGVGLAGAALVLGWFLLLAVVIGATLIVMLIVHAVM